MLKQISIKGFWSVLVFITLALAHEPENTVKQVLQDYARAVEQKDLSKIEKFVVTDERFTVYESGHVNKGWKDYRDHHLAPELKAFEAIQYKFSNIQVVQDQKLAVATLTYSIAVKLPKRSVSATGLGTFVLVQEPDGWKIQHIHTTKIPEKRKKKEE